MNFIFVFILPSVFGFKLMYNNIEKKDKMNLFIYECMILLLSNLICSILFLLKNRAIYNIVEYMNISMGYAIIYIALSSIIGCIIGFLIIVVSKYFNISIEVKYEKKDKKHLKKSK